VWQSLQTGLDDFLTCPLRDIDVLPRIQRLLRRREETTTAPQAVTLRAPWRIAGLVGESCLFRQVLQTVRRIAHADATVLLSGETGTGKELIARVIHYQSPRRGKPFVPVNCGALPDHLLENELFGHVKGAYTDASSPEQGLVAEAEQGTLFLDEVDTLSPAAQVKLLRFLQDGEYRPLGSAKSHTADVRIIAATNADLQQRVQAQRFREDLYYRLNIIALRLPPLRERREDIPLLASYFLRCYGKRYGRPVPGLSAAAFHKLVTYPWPGNVRELETVLQRAILLSSAAVLQPEDIDLPDRLGRLEPEPDAFSEARARVIEQFERTYLTNLLAAHQGNITRAARQAGQARRSLQRLLKKYGLKRRPC
jgi:DNA-binding NtrC family response regulator